MAIFPRLPGTSLFRQPLRPYVLGSLSACLLVPALATGCANGAQSTAPTTVDGPAVSGSPAGSSPADSSPASSAATSPTPSSASTSVPSESVSSSPAASSNAQPARCALSKLRVGVRPSEGGGAAGSNYVLLTFHNISSNECSLYGWPGVSFVGHHNGTQLGAPAIQVQGDQRKTVKLDPGATTTAVLRIVNAGNFGSCGATTADGFRVYPPGSRASAFVADRVSACQDTKVKQLEISPVGTSG